MYPTTIVLDPAKAQQQKTILLRNPSRQDIIVKIYTLGSVSVERDRLVLKSNERVEIRATFKLQPVGPPPEVLIFARGVTKTNLVELKNWLEVPLSAEKRIHRAFKLVCLAHYGVFSSSMVVLDLPGNAGSREDKSQVEDADIATAENGQPLMLATPPPPRAQLKKLPPVVKEVVHEEVEVKEETEKNEPCTFLRNLMDVFYPPTIEKTRIAGK